MPDGSHPALPTTPEPPCLTAALGYAARGWRVFVTHGPSETDPKKKKAPLWDRDLQPNGCLSASTDPDHIRELWRLYPRANVAIATGKESGITVVDYDGKHATALAKRHGLTAPETYTVKTPHGFHLYIKYDERLQQGAAILVAGDECDCEKKCQIDVRNDGGYVIAPPSVIA